MISTYAGNLALQTLFTDNANLFVKLHTGDPTIAGTANELSTSVDADYVAKAVTFGSPSTLSVANSTAVSFTADVAATAYTITHISIHDTTLVNCHAVMQLLAPINMVAGKTVTFAIGDIVETITNIA